MNPSELSIENIIASVIAGVGIGYVTLRNYFKKKDQPDKAPNGDRMIPGITIADMNPIRDLAVEQKRTAIAAERMAEAGERLATATEALVKMRSEQAQDDAMEEEVQRRFDREVERRVEREVERELEERARAARTRRRKTVA